MKTPLLITLLCASAPLFAAPLSPEAALQRVRGDRNLKPGMVPHADMELMKTVRSGNRPSVYLFANQKGNGFMVVSADDATSPLLGYGDTDLNAPGGQLPPAFEYWMSALSDQVAFNAAHCNAPTKTVMEAWDNIPPLVKTEWNQSAPYNNDCPMIGTKRCYTGCVATAMAQVLKYYNYPEAGTGTHSYTWQYTNTSGQQASQTLSFDYSSTNFDWSNMTDTYSSASTAEQNAAVAQLMYACGVGVDMIYGTNESGAISFNMVRALTENFGYANSMKCLMRDYYGIDDWNKIVYDNLKNYGPVLYGGQSNDGGHQFVCDGYNNGYFHFNWGWGGMSNGYFLLTALDPAAQGIGGSTSGYNFSQDIVVGLKATPSTGAPFAQILWDGDFTVSPLQTTQGSTITYSGSFVNYSSGTLTNPQIGLTITPSDGSAPTFLEYSYFASLQPMTGLQNTDFNITLPQGLADGTYTVAPAFKTQDGTVTEMGTAVNATGTYTMTVNGNDVSFTPDSPATLTVNSVSLESDLYMNMPFQLLADVKNNDPDREYLGNLAVALMRNDSIIVGATQMAVDLEPGAEMQLDYVSQLKYLLAENATVTPGEYKLALCKVTGSAYTPIAATIPVTLNAASNPTLSVPAVTIASGQRSASMTASAQIRCSSGYFAGYPKLVIFDGTTGTMVSEFNSDFLCLQAPASSSSMEKAAPSFAIVRYNFSLDNNEANKKYLGAVFVNGQQMSNAVSFTTNPSTGIEDMADNDAVSTEYISMTGLSLGTQRPAKGIYIARTRHTDGSVTSQRVNITD